MEQQDIFHRILQEGLASAEGRTVAEVRQRVAEETASVAEQMRAIMGDDAAQHLERAERQWSSGIHYDDTIRIDAIAASDGAAGMHHMGTRVTTLDTGALEAERNVEYWNRVEAHEKEHAKQASTFTVAVIDMDGQRTASITDLVEWGAIAAAEQPDADLTADYQRHRRVGEEIAGIVGKEVLMQALHTGDLTSVQEKVRTEMSQTLGA